MRSRVLVLVGFGLAACEPALPDPWPRPQEDAGTAAKVVTVAEGAANLSRVDAMSDDTFTALDLDTGAEVPFEPAAWDLAFQRFHIRARGGASGGGGVQVAPLEGTAFDAVTAAPASGWLEDQPDGPDANADLDTVFETAASWYTYDVMTHALTPAPTTYVVRSDQGDHFKVRVEGYYDTAGTPASFTVRWARIAPPP